MRAVICVFVAGASAFSTTLLMKEPESTKEPAFAVAGLAAPQAKVTAASLGLTSADLAEMGVSTEDIEAVVQGPVQNTNEEAVEPRWWSRPDPPKYANKKCYAVNKANNKAESRSESLMRRRIFEALRKSLPAKCEENNYSAAYCKCHAFDRRVLDKCAADDTTHDYVDRCQNQCASHDDYVSGLTDRGPYGYWCSKEEAKKAASCCIRAICYCRNELGGITSYAECGIENPAGHPAVRVRCPSWSTEVWFWNITTFWSKSAGKTIKAPEICPHTTC